MNISVLNQQVETMYGRLAKLYRSLNASSSLELLPAILKELGVASEKMQLMMQEIVRQNEQLTAAQKQIEVEQQRYQNLFEAVSDALIITDIEGTIQTANRAALTLLNVSSNLLLGESIAYFIAPQDRAILQLKMSQLVQRQQLDFTLQLRQAYEHYLNVAVTVCLIPNEATGSTNLRWQLRDITELKRAEAAFDDVDYDPCSDRPVSHYSKGDLIPLEPQTVWLVSHGGIKLTTLSDSGEEILVGLAGKAMVFGASLTSLPIYQATALSEVALVSLAHTEIAQSPKLAQSLLVLINRRLQQSEQFLTIHGNIRVEDRLNRLLHLLKQEVGCPTKDGVRLSVRLTHQEFASACCTTRVTITRLLGRLQQQGKLTIDSQSYLILKD